MTLKRKAVTTALFIPLALFVLKLMVGLVTMSMSVLASAVDSLMDVFSSSIAVAAVRTSEKPPDDKHPFGHGKAEPIAGLVQSFLIIISVFFLIYQSFKKIIHGYALMDEALGIAMMLVGIASSIFLTAFMKKAAKESDSSVVSALALNFGADVWTNAGVLLALGLEKWGAVKNADPILSILISLYIAVSAIRIAQHSISQLMDKTLPNEMILIIDECIKSHAPYARGYHKLRTRSVGPSKEIEFHIEIDSKLSFQKAHEITEIIIADIERKIPNSRVIAHSDPI
jgi:cation diffusion facilitator family transporter